MVGCFFCGALGTGTLVSSEDMRKAVFKKGFDPFALGLFSPAFIRSLPFSLTFERWKNITVPQSTSDWNICAGCMSKLRPYLEEKPKPTGVMESTASTNSLLGAITAKEAEEKYKRKKRLQFWKR